MLLDCPTFYCKTATRWWGRDAFEGLIAEWNAVCQRVAREMEEEAEKAKEDERRAHLCERDKIDQAIRELREWCQKFGASLEARHVGEIVAKLEGFAGRVELDLVDAKLLAWVVRYEDR